MRERVRIATRRTAMSADPALGAAAPVLAWVLTYALHSTLLLGAAWAAARLARRDERLQEWLWKTAVVGAVATTSAQAALGLRPLAGSWRLAPRAEVVADVAPANALWVQARVERAPDAPPGPLPDPLAGELLLFVTDEGALPASAATVAAVGGSGARWRRVGAVGAGAWLAGALFGALSTLLGWRRLRRELAGRAEVVDGPLRARLDRLARRAGVRRRVRLFHAPRLVSPITSGLLRPCIVLPSAVAVEMDGGAQDAVLAHELGHVVRRDPAWQALVRAVEALFFFQPLNRLARRRLAELAEYRCDDFALVHSGRPLSLARCLTEVAGRMARAGRALPVPAMSGTRSQLARRIERILDERRAPVLARPRPRLLAAGATLLATAVLVAPGVSADGERARPGVGGSPRADDRARETGRWTLELAPSPRGAAGAGVRRALRFDGPHEDPQLVELVLGLDALGSELTELRGEIARLGDELGRRADAERLAPLLEELEHRAGGVAARRERLAGMLPAVLEQRAPQVPRTLTSSPESGHGQ